MDTFINIISAQPWCLPYAKEVSKHYIDGAGSPHEDNLRS